MDTYTKDEVHQAIENKICTWCKNYQEGHFGCLCSICKVFEVFSVIDEMGDKDK